MESRTCLCSSTLLPSCLPVPQSFNLDGSKSRIRIFSQPKRVSSSTARVYASSSSWRDGHDQNCGGHRLVDENMIVLRKRIHEMKMVERNYEPPENWMGWEKRYYTSYDSLICEALGVLQSQLMNTRPSLALGVIALIALSVPTSTALLCFHLMEITKGILAGIHFL
ncbi:Mediator of RNA polymerase II transcription subunit [Melia azedarach]|uniref:Mediator of RNA polymerase II transcription subunit n=1 Tax=Melia azedarach TaxID=155640 RepID=A0ACC1XGE0_MELAZ|nr:Mediator of RNA polymerase II transcription subunit [Melia azedarach]